jgi:hypothetical protein
VGFGFAFSPAFGSDILKPSRNLTFILRRRKFWGTKVAPSCRIAVFYAMDPTTARSRRIYGSISKKVRSPSVRMAVRLFEENQMRARSLSEFFQIIRFRDALAISVNKILMADQKNTLHTTA